MRTHIFYLTVAILLAFSFSSCSKEDDCNPEDSDSPCYIGNSGGNKMLLTEEKVNGQTQLSFEYDGYNRMSVYHISSKDGSGVHTARFTYNDKGLLTAVTHSQAGQHQYLEEYSYGSGDKPISGLWTFPDNIVSLQYNYEKNTVTEKSFNTNGEQLGHNTYYFDNKGENIVKIVISGEGLVLTTHEYGDYDDKYYRFTNYPWNWKSRSGNNPKSYKLTAQGAAGGGAVLDQIWKYTYNAAGYPVKAEIYNSGSDVIAETRTYNYIPAK